MYRRCSLSTLHQRLALSRRFAVRKISTIPQPKSVDTKRIVISVASIGISGLALYALFKYEKQAALDRAVARQQEASAAGSALIGGPFSLVDLSGRPVSDLDFRGKYLLMYFGYTFCPEELEKMAAVIDKIDATFPDAITPVFISCDPKRDSISLLKEYLAEYHPKFIGLTGTHAQIKRVARAYRMYYSAPPRALDEDDADYLVDHSIFFYLVDPEGKYRMHFGRVDGVDEVYDRVLECIQMDLGIKK